MPNHISSQYSAGSGAAIDHLGLEKVAFLPALGAGLMAAGRMALPWIARMGTRALAGGGRTLGARALNGAFFAAPSLIGGDAKGGLMSGAVAAAFGPMGGMAASMIPRSPAPPPATYGSY